MSKIVELLLTKKPKDSQAKTDLSKPRGGQIGGTTGGFNPSKKYADSVNTAKNK
jgi:hypothetical protein